MNYIKNKIDNLHLLLDGVMKGIKIEIDAIIGRSYKECLLVIEALRVEFKKFEKDEVYEEAVKLILETKQASVSVLQRRLGLGYTRAARLIDMMEDEGLVGPYQGSKPRDILMSQEEYQSKNDTGK